MGSYTRNFDAKCDAETGRFDEDRQERARPRFWLDEVLNPKTQNIDKVEMIQILVPGETKNVFGGKVTDDHRRRFPREYAAFKAGEEMPVTGHALSKLPGMTPNLLAELRFLGFVSAEDLARATDNAIGQFMAGLTWRRKAQIWLDEQRALEGAAQSSTEKDAVIAQQGAALEEIKAQMAALSAQMLANAPKKPGRKPKAVHAPSEAA